MVLKRNELYKAERMTTRLIERQLAGYTSYMAENNNSVSGDEQLFEYRGIRERLGIVYNLFAVIKALKKQHLEAYQLIDVALLLST